jgi:diguanylate cyclase (GGDEF)-like protein/PAS domain S-box-containing protein
LAVGATTARIAPPRADAAAVEFIDACPVAAVLAGDDGSVLHANEAAQPIAELIARHDPQHGPLRVLDRTYETQTLPWPVAGLRVVLLRDITAERNLTSALVKSRQLFKDLVNCSADFAWETDPSGRLGFVSPRGALGYSARELQGRAARELLIDPPEDGAPPFTARVAVDDAEVWLRRADGEPACVLVSCLPLYDREDSYLGARGVARDVTEAKRRDAALAAARNREALIDGILDAARTEAEPARMLAAAAEIAAKALHAGDARILGRDEDTGAWLEAAHWRDGTLLEAATSPDAEASPARLVAEIQHRGRVNGMLRIAAGHAFDDEARALFAGVAAQLGSPVEQLALYHQLDRLSRIDPLTGVHNRRAFLDTLASRLGHLRRYQRAGALLFIDLDNFKALNDRRGHAAGDAALIAVARLLGEGSRRGDVAGRLGGDEFALWLEETDAAGAAAKADALIAAVAREPAAQAGDPDRALGVSIGIALWPLAVAGNDSPAALVARADAAMYAAKRDGKNRWSLAGTG